MTVEAFVEGLSRRDKLVVMELIWRDLTIDPSTFESPAWHDSGDYFVKCIFEDLERLEMFAGIHERRGRK